MTVSEPKVACRECLAPRPSALLHAEPFPPCPDCGCATALVEVVIAEQVGEMHDSVAYAAYEDGKSRKKGRIAWGVAKRDWFHREGAWANVRRQFNKPEDTYEEIITYADSGEMIREVREPLSEHQGRGSAKPPRKPEA